MTIPLPTIPRTFRCALKWLDPGSGQTWVNVIHIQAADTTTDTSGVWHDLDATVTAGMWGHTLTTTGMVQAAITPLGTGGATQFYSNSGAAKWRGAQAGDFVPAAAVIVKETTTLRGRKHRGRIFLGQPVEGIISNGTLQSSLQGTMTTAWQTFLAALPSASVSVNTLVVASYDRAHAGAGAVATPVVGVSVEGTLGTQRRRQGRLR